MPLLGAFLNVPSSGLKAMNSPQKGVFLMDSINWRFSFLLQSFANIHYLFSLSLYNMYFLYIPLRCLLEQMRERCMFKICGLSGIIENLFQVTPALSRRFFLSEKSYLMFSGKNQILIYMYNFYVFVMC